MFRKMFWVVLLLGSIAATGCHGRAAIYGRADYHGEYPYRQAGPYYYNPFYDPFLYPVYIDELYPYYYFGGSFIYGYPYYPYSFYTYYPNYFYPYPRRFVGPGDRSLRGFRDGRSGHPTAPRPRPDRSLR